MKKVLALLLAALLAFSCFACEPTEPGESKNETSADPTVTDGDVFTLNVWDEDHTYIIPKIVFEKDGTAALNQAIRDNLYAEYISKVKLPVEKEDIPRYNSMSYMWGYKNGYLSIAEFCPIFASEGQDLHVFYMDMETMEMTDGYNLLKAYSLTKDEFFAQAKKAMAQAMYENLQAALLSNDYSEKTQAETLYAKILNDENVTTSVPFIGEGGKLMVECTLGSIWGSDSYISFLDYDTALTGDAKTYFDNFDFATAGKFEVSVVDGEVWKKTYEDEEYGTISYVLPKVICPKGAEDVINNTLMAAAHERLDSSLARDSYPNITPFHYYWGVKDNVLTVVFECYPAVTNNPSYYLFTFDVITGKQLNMDEVLAFYGIYDTDTFYATARDRMGTTVIEGFGGSLTDANPDLEDYIHQAFNYTLDMENVQQAVPFVGPDGALYFIGKIGQAAGAAYHWEMLPYEGNISAVYKNEYGKVSVVEGESIRVDYTNHNNGASHGYFTFPKIIARNYAKEDTANATLLAFVKDFLGKSLTDTEYGGAYTNLHYEWGVKDQYVSVVIWSHLGPSDTEGYAAITINLATGKAIDEAALLKLVGITDMTAYKQQVKDRMGTVYLEIHADEEVNDLFLDGFRFTFNDKHHSAAIPYLGEGGNLWIAAPIGKGAGSTMDWHRFAYKGTVSDLYKTMYALYVEE